MKYIITEEQIKRLEFKYLDYLFEDMNEVHSEKYPNSRFWKKDGEVVLELRISGDLWVSYPIWNDISSVFSLDFNETQQLIKEWVEKHLKLEDITPWKVKLAVEERWKNI
jgi:hypothetical protein